MALIQCDFYSDTLGLCCSMNVILPQTTQTQIGLTGKAGSSRKHPVLYLLHGLSDDHSIWLRRTSIERYASTLGLAVVMPAVNRSYYTNMHSGPQYWTFISEELPRLAESFFPISSRREDTFAAGLSMGGYGAFKLALAKPGKFAAAASLSGALDPTFLRARTPAESREFKGIFGPKSIKGTPNDLYWLAHTLARPGAPRPKFFQCCGREDFLYKDNLKFRDFLKTLKFDLTYEEGPGAHEWGYWDTQIQRVLKWLPLGSR